MHVWLAGASIASIIHVWLAGCVYSGPILASLGQRDQQAYMQVLLHFRVSADDNTVHSRTDNLGSSHMIAGHDQDSSMSMRLAADPHQEQWHTYPRKTDKPDCFGGLSGHHHTFCFILVSLVWVVGPSLT